MNTRRPAQTVTTTEPSLLQRYADLRDQAGGITRSMRGMRLNKLLADAFERDGIDAEADQRGPHGEVDVALYHDGTWYLLEGKWYADPVTDEPLRHLRDVLTQRRPGTIGILASMSGFTASALRRAETSSNVILFDQSHIEALITGAASGPELIAAANRYISVFGHPRTPLAKLLRPRRPEAEPLRLGPPSGFTADAVAAPDGIDATVVVHGPTILGIASNRERLLVTVADGVLDVPTRAEQGQPRWRVEMSSCAGNPIASPNGDLLVVRHGGVVRATGEELAIVAGGFARPPQLVPGPTGALWLLDLDTTGWSGSEQATLVDVGATLGAAGRSTAGLPAGACKAACWLHGRTFFVLGEGHSAVVDVDNGEYRWIVTPVGRPCGLVRLDDHRVLVVGSDRHPQIATVDTATGQTSPPVAVNLTGPIRGATQVGEEIFIVAGAPVDSATVIPVIARVDLPKLLASS